MKNVVKKLLIIDLPLRIFLAISSGAALFYVFKNSLDDSMLGYFSFVLSAYTLAIWIIPCVKAVKKINAIINSHSLGVRYINNLQFKGQLSLVSMTVVNTCYAMFEIVIASYNQSSWHGALGIYYLFLAAARGVLLHSLYSKANRKKQLKAALLCGWLLFGLNFALAWVTAQMVINGKGYAYSGTLIYAVAFYAFYSVVIAIINLIRFRRLQSPVLSASKIISIATALVSILSLQTAMFASFGGSFEYQTLMNGLTGAGVCILIFVSAILMIINIKKEIKNIEINKT